MERSSCPCSRCSHGSAAFASSAPQLALERHANIDTNHDGASTGAVRSRESSHTVELKTHLLHSRQTTANACMCTQRTRWRLCKRKTSRCRTEASRTIQQSHRRGPQVFKSPLLEQLLRRRRQWHDCYATPGGPDYRARGSNQPGDSR